MPSVVAEVNVHEAKTNLSRLLARVEAGEEIVIARAGKPIARLIPIETPRPPRRFGLMKDRIAVGADFDDPLPPEIQRYFEGGED